MLPLLHTFSHRGNNTLKLMFFNLYIANNTYYVIIDSPKTTTEWILTAYGKKICTLKTHNKKQGIKAVTIIALIHYLESLQTVKTNTYIHTSNQLIQIT